MEVLAFHPRVLRHRPRGAIRLEKAVLRGEWAPLFCEALSQLWPQDPQLSEPDAEACARRAMNLAHLGELSNAERRPPSHTPLWTPILLCGSLLCPSWFSTLHLLPTFAVRAKELPQASLASRRKFPVLSSMMPRSPRHFLMSPPSLPVPASLTTLCHPFDLGVSSRCANPTVARKPL